MNKLVAELVKINGDVKCLVRIDSKGNALRLTTYKDEAQDEWTTTAHWRCSVDDVILFYQSTGYKITKLWN